MGFGPFLLISLFYAVIGVRVVRQLVARRREVFDLRFTPADRALVDQAAFFVLVPISVALHEFGHAVAIWGFGGRVESWGYYLFAGFVGFDPSDFTRAERVVVAAAGTLVNLLLGIGALALVFGRRPPMRAAYNELLIQFTFLSVLNALVVYPLLDLFSGLNGDWSQMYRGGVPALSAVIFVVHAGTLGAGFWAWRNDRVKARIATLTDAAPGAFGALRRVPLGGRGPTGRAVESPPPDPSSPEAVLHEAARRVASGWSAAVEAAIQRRPEGVLLVLSWHGGGLRRSVLAWAAGQSRTGDVELSGAAGPDDIAPTGRPLGREPGPLDADRLTLALRLAMEQVEVWTPAEHSTGSS